MTDTNALRLTLDVLYQMKFDIECGASVNRRKLTMAIDILCDVLENNTDCNQIRRLRADKPI